MRLMFTLLFVSLFVPIFQNCAPATSAKTSLNSIGIENPDDNEDIEILRNDQDPTINGIEIQRHPPGTLYSNQTQIHFLLGPFGGANIVDFLCSLNGSDFESCESPVELLNLEQGLHTLVLRAVNEDNNELQSEYSWRVDLQPRALALTGLPLSPTRLSTAQFSYITRELNGASESVECRIDDGDFQPCRSPMFYENLSIGEHRFELRLNDATGGSETLSQPWERVQ